MPEGQVTPHPYYPRNLFLPGYRPNRVPLTELLGLFFGLVAIALISTWILAGRFNKRGADRVVICWFVVCGFIHSVLEGYFAANHETIIGGGSYLAEMWKEYGRGDSRYLTFMLEKWDGFRTRNVTRKEGLTHSRSAWKPLQPC
nr:3-beta-hydroxysteroid-Delta(8),Delta(7)-isomerase isoform X2 [Crassostrea gigas]